MSPLAESTAAEYKAIFQKLASCLSDVVRVLKADSLSLIGQHLESSLCKACLSVLASSRWSTPPSLSIACCKAVSVGVAQGLALIGALKDSFFPTHRWLLAALARDAQRSVSLSTRSHLTRPRPSSPSPRSWSYSKRPFSGERDSDVSWLSLQQALQQWLGDIHATPDQPALWLETYRERGEASSNPLRTSPSSSSTTSSVHHAVTTLTALSTHS